MLVPAVPDRRRPGRACRRSRPASSTRRSSSRPRTSSRPRARRMAPRRARLVSSTRRSAQPIFTDVDRHGRRARRRRSSWRAAASWCRAAARTPFEFVYECLEQLRDRARRARRRRPYVPIFAAFFLFILFTNWSGLMPLVGKIEQLRAPTERRQHHDRPRPRQLLHLPRRGLPPPRLPRLSRQVLPVCEFKNGIGAGFIALFVGVIEFFLEFVKPVTLSMRLFGNIYGGEVALGVITALTISIIPVAHGQPGGPAQLHAGPHLQRADADVHRHRHREPPRGGARPRAERRIAPDRASDSTASPLSAAEPRITTAQ